MANDVCKVHPTGQHVNGCVIAVDDQTTVTLVKPAWLAPTADYSADRADQEIRDNRIYVVGQGWPSDPRAWVDASDLAKGPIVHVDVEIISEDVVSDADPT